MFREHELQKLKKGDLIEVILDMQENMIQKPRKTCKNCDKSYRDRWGYYCHVNKGYKIDINSPACPQWTHRKSPLW